MPITGGTATKIADLDNLNAAGIPTGLSLDPVTQQLYITTSYFDAPGGGGYRTIRPRTPTTFSSISSARTELVRQPGGELLAGASPGRDADRQQRASGRIGLEPVAALSLSPARARMRSSRATRSRSRARSPAPTTADTIPAPPSRSLAERSRRTRPAATTIISSCWMDWRNARAACSPAPISRSATTTAPTC